MRLLVFCALTVAFVAAYDRSSLDRALHRFDDSRFSSAWEAFKFEYRKAYASAEEEAEHFSVFVRNFFAIAHHNARGKSFRLGMSEIADLPMAKYHQMNGYRRPENYSSTGIRYHAPLNVAVPDSVDWRESGFVTPGQCGSCWAFASTGALEGQNKRANGELVSLSEQNLVDCSRENHGCNGGLPDRAYAFIKKEGGVDTEESYPYTAKDGKCQFDPANVGAKDKGFFDIAQEDEEALKKAVATQGPVSVAIDASNLSFQLYKSGVYYEKKCTEILQIDHAVLVVGYGTDAKGGDYWLIKNSWGETWGEKGYMKMARNRDNHCGIASSASFPIV